tara:strand:+ start:383 stop:1258 length:876 start_codon:yes stop_codon:yes gene_type:complete
MNRFCLGTVQFGLKYGISNKIGKPKKKQVKDIIRFAVDNNIDLFDTAQSYGNSEQLLGEIFNELGVQNDIKVISKLSPNFKINEVHVQINKSLDNLMIDSLWGLLLHRYEPSLINNKLRELIINSKKENKILNFGVSIYNPSDAIEALNESLFDIIQVPFNILDRRLIDNKFFEIAKEKNKKVFIRSIYLQGLLLMSNSDLKNKNMDWAIPMLSELHEYSKLYKIELKSFASTAINNYVSDCYLITGVDSLNQLKENLQMLNECKYSNEVFKNWWKDLKLYPEKLLNPSLW